MRGWLNCFVLLMATGVPAILHAQGSTEKALCRNGLFPREDVQLSLAKVGGTSPLHFLWDWDGCPTQGGGKCVQKAYVVPGDFVLVGKAQDGYRCAFYPNRAGGSAGWVPMDRLQEVAVNMAPAPTAWAGQWVNVDDTLVIDVAGSGLRVWGRAWWPGRNPPPMQFPGGPNVGGVKAVAKPSGNVVTFVEAECSVKATLINELLVVSDNHICGGMNVNFDGVYRRKP